MKTFWTVAPGLARIPLVLVRILRVELLFLAIAAAGLALETARRRREARAATDPTADEAVEGAR
jgi:hypothetical protein